MEWRGEGVLIARRRHGESGAIVELFTHAQGRHAGFVPGGAGRRLAPVLQPGAQLAVTWRARLADQIGTYRVEPMRARAAALFDDPAALAALSAVTALLSWALPEREPHPGLYSATIGLLDGLGGPAWPMIYARWELALLRDLGFGPDLTRCALTGAQSGLSHIELASGRAVSGRAAQDLPAAQLRPLPAFLTAREPEERQTADASSAAAAPPVDDADALRQALDLTGHYLDAWLGAALERPGLPPARDRLLARLTRQGGTPAPLHPAR
ncbi:MAG: DNA repair protein RecO [Pseudomonadota bacterium]